jgi:hypothetical protein
VKIDELGNGFYIFFNVSESWNVPLSDNILYRLYTTECIQSGNDWLVTLFYPLCTVYVNKAVERSAS